MITKLEEVAAALEARFVAVVEESAGKPFAQTKVDMPAKAIWLGYARAALEALVEPSEGIVEAMSGWGQHSGHHELVWRAGIQAALEGK